MCTFWTNISIRKFNSSLRYLVEIIQPNLSKKKHSVLNSSSFAEESKKRNKSLSEIQTFFNAVNIYPSVPIDEAVAVIIEILNNDIGWFLCHITQKLGVNYMASNKEDIPL